MKSTRIAVFVCLLTLLPVIPASAQSTDCNNPTRVAPDGRSFAGTIPASTTLWFSFQARALSSYSVEANYTTSADAAFPAVGAFASTDISMGCTGASTLNPRNTPRVDKEIKKLTGGGVDIAFECIGKPAIMRSAFDSVRRGGRMVVVGFCTDEVPLPLAKVMYYEIEVVGSLGCPPVEYPRLIELVRRGRIQLAPMVTSKMPLEDINDAFDLLRRGEGLRSIVIPGLARGAERREHAAAQDTRLSCATPSSCCWRSIGRSWGGSSDCDRRCATSRRAAMPPWPGASWRCSRSAR